MSARTPCASSQGADGRGLDSDSTSVWRSALFLSVPASLCGQIDMRGLDCPQELLGVNKWKNFSHTLFSLGVTWRLEDCRLVLPSPAPFPSSTTGQVHHLSSFCGHLLSGSQPQGGLATYSVPLCGSSGFGFHRLGLATSFFLFNQSS